MTSHGAPDTPDGRGAADSDDQHWLDLLAGRAAPGANAATRQHAVSLRAALLRARAAAPAGTAAAADARLLRLLQRARGAGVLPADAQGGVVRPPGQVRQTGGRAANQWRYAAAACVAAGAALLVWRPDRTSDLSPDRTPDASTASGTLRGAAQQRVESPNPPARRQLLLQALRDAGFDAQPFDRLGRPGIDIALPVPLQPAQAAALLRLGLQPPAGPGLQIEIVPPAQGERQ